VGAVSTQQSFRGIIIPLFIWLDIFWQNEANFILDFNEDANLTR
jgi:hypothetical protein